MEFINQNILLIGVVVTSGLALAWQFLAKNSAAINPAEATLLINREDAQVVDVREADEFAGGHLPEARNIPAGKLADRVGEIEKFKDRPLILCCASGIRSGKACEQLKKAGFTRLYSLDGGFDAWRQAGLPVRKGSRGK
ncbi:MAG: rhodanese-like domain-containing protein [Betaproteobacteria bacterium]|jgi:rhodanese-related sulfurtransferase|nr:rhodanese-like domain-containing protein [Betaproteobacteria bacterium]HMV21983.1 rhodanese-like domain-containing protein [Rhodocyclaceae bacterium]HNE42358.1 rhodanese-like domain-containing protein [Rhodocyclaceae bacterium]HNL21321.1 rhodanese-like domain-containing protein [Rhodocyclaceae bacterium]HNM23195.1 rhodanese-like domain-containing protein [Rhodocyclaceae bacterium]